MPCVGRFGRARRRLRPTVLVSGGLAQQRADEPAKSVQRFSRFSLPPLFSCSSPTPSDTLWPPSCISSSRRLFSAPCSVTFFWSKDAKHEVLSPLALGFILDNKELDLAVPPKKLLGGLLVCAPAALHQLGTDVSGLIAHVMILIHPLTEPSLRGFGPASMKSPCRRRPNLEDPVDSVFFRQRPPEIRIKAKLGRTEKLNKNCLSRRYPVFDSRWQGVFARRLTMPIAGNRMSDHLQSPSTPYEDGRYQRFPHGDRIIASSPACRSSLSQAPSSSSPATMPWRSSLIVLSARNSLVHKRKLYSLGNIAIP